MIVALFIVMLVQAYVIDHLLWEKYTTRRDIEQALIDHKIIKLNKNEN